MTTPDPRKAWRRGSLYLVAVLLVAVVTGTVSWVLDDVDLVPATGPATVWGLALIALAAVLYGGIWARGTTHFDRPLAVPWSAGFGLIWGSAAAVIVLIGWQVSLRLLDPGPWQVVVALLAVSAWQGGFQATYWDVHVSPEHNLPEWNLRKVLVVHVPNLIASGVYLTAYETVGPVVVAQVLAIVISCLVMRFPAPNAPVGALEVSDLEVADRLTQGRTLG